MIGTGAHNLSNGLLLVGLAVDDLIEGHVNLLTDIGLTIVNPRSGQLAVSSLGESSALQLAAANISIGSVDSRALTPVS